VYSAYAPPAPKKKKAQRTRFNGRGRKAQALPAVATASQEKGVTMKPGKREKIRFGQAPRETLPPAVTTEENAAADTTTPQVAANTGAPQSVSVDEAPEQQPVTKQKKTRFSDQARLPKAKTHKGPKIDPFAPAPETKLETADRAQQDKALGLNGDTSKKKKVNPRKEGPKRRFGDDKNDAAPATEATPSTQAAPSSGQQ
jgi:peptidyl-prolyl cis-trans isomerase SurA